MACPVRCLLSGGKPLVFKQESGEGDICGSAVATCRNLQFRFQTWIVGLLQTIVQFVQIRMLPRADVESTDSAPASRQVERDASGREKRQEFPGQRKRLSESGWGGRVGVVGWGLWSSFSKGAQGLGLVEFELK